MKTLKIVLIIVVFSLAFLSGCKNNENSKPELDINGPGTVYDELMDSEGEWILDPTGTFSYMAMKSIGNSRPFISDEYVFPGNYFIYETNTPHIDDEKLYGYMDINFKKLCDPISTSPNIFMFNLARIETDSGYYIVDNKFEKQTEIYPGYVLTDGSLIRVDWTDKPAANPYVVPDINFDEYLVPFNISDDPEYPLFGYKTVNDAYFKDIPAEENFAVSPVFTAAKPFQEGLAAVQYEGKWGYINEAGAPDFLLPNYIGTDAINPITH